MADGLSLASRDSRARRNSLAQLLLQQSASNEPIRAHSQGIAKMAQALIGGYMMGDQERRGRDSNETLARAYESALAAGGAAPGTPITGSTESPSSPVNATAPADLLPVFARSEQQYGLPANYLAQTAGIESRFNPNAQNPNSSAGGLFQFIDSTARQYGLADKFDPLAATDAAARLAADNAKVLGRTLQRAPTAGELYLAHQQGAGGAAKLLANPDARAVDLVGADAVRLNGGNPNMTAAEFARRWTSKLASNEADMPASGASTAAMEGGQHGFAVPPGPQPAMTGQTFDAITAGQPLDPVFQSEGVSQPWMNTAIPPQAAGPQMAQAPLPPPRPSDLADLPAPGAVPAMGQMPPPVAPQIDPNSPDGGVRAQIAANAQGGASPFSGIAQALMGGGTAPVTPSAGPDVRGVAQALAPQAAAAPAAQSPGGMGALAVALIRSGNVDAGVKLASNLLQPQAGVTMGDRLVDPRTGRVIADFTQANGGRSRQYGMTPIYGTDAQGNPVMLQVGEKGDAVQTRLPEGVKLAPGTSRVDLGTTWGVVDRSGNLVSTIPKDLAGAERAKVEGKTQGEASAGLGGAVAQAGQVLSTIDQVRKHPGRSEFGATGWGSTFPIVGSGVPGSKGRDFVGLVDQLKGQAFLDAFDALKGGGAISEAEGKVATQARARLDRAQSKEGFDKALDDLEGVIRRGMENARKKAGGASAAPASGVDTSKPGNFRFNPSTGKMEPA